MCEAPLPARTYLHGPLLFAALKCNLVTGFVIIPTFSTEPSDIFYSASVTDLAIDSAIANVSRLALSYYIIKYRIIDYEIGVTKGGWRSSILLRDPTTIRRTYC